MSLKNVHDLEGIVLITEENQVPPVCKAAHVGTQFRTRTAQSAGERRKLAALLAKLIDKPSANDTITTLPGNIHEDPGEIPERTVEENKFAHSVTGFGQLRFLRVQRANEIILGIVPAAGDRGIKRLS